MGGLLYYIIQTKIWFASYCREYVPVDICKLFCISKLFGFLQKKSTTCRQGWYIFNQKNRQNQILWQIKITELPIIKTPNPGSFFWVFFCGGIRLAGWVLGVYVRPCLFFFDAPWCVQTERRRRKMDLVSICICNVNKLAGPWQSPNDMRANPCDCYFTPRMSLQM